MASTKWGDDPLTEDEFRRRVDEFRRRIDEHRIVAPVAWDRIRCVAFIGVSHRRFEGEMYILGATRLASGMYRKRDPMRGVVSIFHHVTDERDVQGQEFEDVVEGPDPVSDRLRDYVMAHLRPHEEAPPWAAPSPPAAPPDHAEAAAKNVLYGMLEELE